MIKEQIKLKEDIEKTEKTIEYIMSKKRYFFILNANKISNLIFFYFFIFLMFIAGLTYLYPDPATLNPTMVYSALIVFLVLSTLIFPKIFHLFFIDSKIKNISIKRFLMYLKTLNIAKEKLVVQKSQVVDIESNIELYYEEVCSYYRSGRIEELDSDFLNKIIYYKRKVSGIKSLDRIKLSSKNEVINEIENI